MKKTPIDCSFSWHSNCTLQYSMNNANQKEKELPATSDYLYVVMDLIFEQDLRGEQLALDLWCRLSKERN